MPNHCDQTVYLHGASKVVYELYQYLSPDLCDDPRFCSVISPMPLQVLPVSYTHLTLPTILLV